MHSIYIQKHIIIATFKEHIKLVIVFNTNKYLYANKGG